MPIDGVFVALMGDEIRITMRGYGAYDARASFPYVVSLRCGGSLDGGSPLPGMNLVRAAPDVILVRTGR